jgi:hypothetical protein
MVVNVRTHDDLRDLLRNRQSGNWKISETTEPSITKVRVFNWDNDQVLKGDFDPSRSIRDAKDDLIIGISKCRIENFKSKGKFFKIFGMAAVVYTPPVSIQKSNGETVGILRDANLVEMNQNEIDVFFNRLFNEILLCGLNKIVFKAGGIPIPDSFKELCEKSNVSIEILTDEELERRYPIVQDILWEEDSMEEDSSMNKRDKL